MRTDITSLLKQVISEFQTRSRTTGGPGGEGHTRKQHACRNGGLKCFGKGR